MLKLGWLGVGMRMEIYASGQRLVTTPVQALRVERLGAEDEQKNLNQSVAANKVQPLMKEAVKV